jgi:acetoin:2,6-dichlorophenolindophenol oxidoreductase subunit beta
MARQIPYIAAINEAIHLEMARDESVLYYGQNLATTEDDPFVQAFGNDRVRVTPISETAEIGMAVGAALAGLRPVVELYMAEFIKAGYGFTAGWAGQHTGSIYGMFMGIPGLKIALPATAADAKGLMASAIRDDNPVCFFHHYLLTLEPGEVPEGEYVVPFGQADIRRPGGDVTIVATGFMVGKALAAAESLASEGIEAEVIDPRTLAPLDLATIMTSVEKTGHVVLVDQATRHASASAVIAAEIADQGFSALKGPIKQVTALDASVPYSEPMEAYVLPDEAKIAGAVHQVLGSAPVAAF